MKNTISLVLVLALGLTAEVANADFTFGDPTNLGSTVNTAHKENWPCLSPDGLSLYFSSNRPGGLGGDDLWVTMRATTDDDWGPPVNLGPAVNSSVRDSTPCISPDGLELYFNSINRPGGFGWDDIWVTRRQSEDDVWGEPVNIGSPINTGLPDYGPSISADRLALYFNSNGHGGFGGHDLYVARRSTTGDDWGTPLNLGPVVNGPSHDTAPRISADGLCLFFSDHGVGGYRIGGYGEADIWMVNRATKEDDWGPPVNLGPKVNSSAKDHNPWSDGSVLYFKSTRPGGFGGADLWQAPIIPIVDFNSDGTVDIDDLVILIEHWGTDEKLCDIGPMPWGDGIVDVQDLIVLAEHLFEGIPPVEPEEVNVDENDDGSHVELEQGRILVVTLESNPTTGYRWEQIAAQESILQQMGEAEFKQSDTGGPPLVGAGGWEIFRFKAISAGQMTLQLVYHRTWEEGVEPLKTFSLQVVVR